MSLQTKSIRQKLSNFDFINLFIEELGWDHFTNDLSISKNNITYTLKAIAHKRGVQTFLCLPNADGNIPDYPIRKQIESEVNKYAREHLIIFADESESTQIWQWVFRKSGEPARYREFKYDESQSFEGLIQKLDNIAFTLNDEEQLTLSKVLNKMKGFNKDKVTKKFYEMFKKQHALFLDFIEGVPIEKDQNWYASVMLNRLMFVYFIQKKGFLDNDTNYLRNHLKKVQDEHGNDKFHSFYRHFLIRLFHDGLNKKEPRTQELDSLLGKIPYLNGGFFDYHEIEQKYNDIAIPDEAFENVFQFFDQFEWHLDDRPLQNDKEINPDVLGYIFEKYINQKDMGAYYTKEDITEYISKNTIIPFLFDKAKEKCKIAFEGERNVWDLLIDDPDKYFYDAVTKGIKNDEIRNTNEIEKETISQLPDNISIGLDTQAPNLLERRKYWNTKTPQEFALPTEIWRETIARWQRYFEVRQKIENGEVKSINDLITYNLNIRQFAQDVIEAWEGPELIRAFYKAITQITVLDPTVGSGAFLFAALNILEPLYEACIDRMQNFVDELPQDANISKFSDFKDILAKIEKHPNRQYFIYKSIIINNLYGVDIMDEAVEICKLRLFLKLVAQVETADKIEPLPDIDFNIRAGNTLVGFATHEEVENAVTKTFDFDNNLGKITDKAEDVQALYDVFLEAQMEEDNSVADFKKELRNKLDELNITLNHYLAGEYGFDPKNKTKYDNWLKTHQPFHWFVEFYGILANGGFDVIIGNPPYVRSSKVKSEYTVLNYETENCPDIYSWVLERVAALTITNGRNGMIVPLSLGFSKDFNTIRKVIYKTNSENWFSSYGRIPAALFSHDVRVRNFIHIGFKTNDEKHQFTSRLHRWFENYRPFLIDSLTYVEFQPEFWNNKIPKVNTQNLVNTFESLFKKTTKTIQNYISPRKTEYKINFKKTAYNWLNFCNELPPCYDNNGGLISHTQFDLITFFDENDKEIFNNLLNGKLILLFWVITGDDFHTAKWMFSEFPVDLEMIPNNEYKKIKEMSEELENEMNKNVQFKLNAGKNVGNYNLAKCRNVTDKSDLIFAKYLGFEDIWEDIELYYNQIVRTNFSDE